MLQRGPSQSVEGGILKCSGTALCKGSTRGGMLVGSLTCLAKCPIYKVCSTTVGGLKVRNPAPVPEYQAEC